MTYIFCNKCGKCQSAPSLIWYWGEEEGKCKCKKEVCKFSNNTNYEKTVKKVFQ